MQFNDYHKFTVDEHSIRAVEAATEFLSDPGPLGEAYRGLRDKRMLHLALLVHDLGKGYAEDHCEVGSRLAVDVARGLGLSESDTETLRFLVHKHLMMSHLAQRRDISDERVVVQFAVEVGSTEILQMLYVLTCADLSAVGPGVLNRWKLELITQLYERAREYLSGELTATRSDESLEHRREELRTRCYSQEESSWWNLQVDALPHNYLKGATTDDIADKLTRLAQLRRDEVVSWSRYLPEMNAVEFTIGAYETVTPGIFHKLTGALTSKGLTILSADIHTLADELVLDRFHVLDPDHAGEPTADRLSEINEALVAALTDKSDRKPAFRKVWTSSSSALASSFVPLPTRVQIDNNTSDNYTILDIFAHDRRGLLYAISRTIFELGLSVHVAKIGTYLDQVVDVFYVTDNQNRKVQDEAFLAEVRSGLLTAIEQHSNSTN
jgi:[protein-PII] uridylyltransferase